MKMKKKWCAIPAMVLLALAAALVFLPDLARLWFSHRPRPRMTIDAALRTQTIDALIAKLNRHYVLPEKAREIEALLRQRQKLGADITSVSHDLHMGAYFSPRPVPPDPAGEPDLRGCG